MSILKCCGRRNLEIKMLEENFDETDKAPNSYHVTYLDVVGLVYSIIFHFVDVGFDLYLAYAYFITGKYAYFAWTVAFILLPTIIITLFSIRMYVEDNKNNANSKYALVRIVLCVLGMFLQSAPLIRYVDSLCYAIKSLKAELKSIKKLQEKYFTKMLNEDSDVALLRVFECYLESAPQQVLQTTLLLIDYNQGFNIHLTKQFITITLSFIGMGWCMANYQRCIRFDQEDKQNISTLGTTVQFFWHLNFTVSRILAISALAMLYTFWTCLAVVSHWCTMTVWVAISSKTKFCGNNKIFEIFFSGAIGLVYIFNFLTLRDGPTRNSYLIYYLLCFVENVIAATIWAFKSTVIKNWIYYIFMVLPILCFIFSMVCLITYYQFLHPNKLKSKTIIEETNFYKNNMQNSTLEQNVTLTNEQNYQLCD